MKTVVLTILNCFICALCFSQDAKPIKKLDGSKISQADLPKQLESVVNKANVTGLSVAIINDRKLVYKHTFGFAKNADKVPLNDSTKMYAASFTKPISAYLFLQLVEKGMFSLDTPILKYLKNPIGTYDKWKDLSTDIAFNKVTPRMILSHSSGLPIVRYIQKQGKPDCPARN